MKTEQTFSNLRLLVLLTPALLLVGCATDATGPVVSDTAAGLLSQPSESRKAVAKPAREDRYQTYIGSDVLVKEATPIPLPGPPPAPMIMGMPMAKVVEDSLTLNFEGADIREVLRTVLGEILQENYIVDPRVNGSITLRTSRPIPKSSAIHTLEEVLRMNGAVLIREADGVYRVLPIAVAGKGNLTPQIGGVANPLPTGYSIQIVPLRYIGAADMAKILEPLAGEASTVRTDVLRNALILAGTQMQLRHLIETVDMFDVDWLAGMSVGFFSLQYADSKSIISELESLFGDKNLGPLAGIVKILPIERINALLVVTPQSRNIELARVWIERLDRPSNSEGGLRLFVYPVQNGKAEKLAGLLNDVFSKKSPSSSRAASAPSLAPGLRPAEVKSADAGAAVKTAFSSASVSATLEGMGSLQDVRIIADNDNNALLILATPSDYERLESTLRKLDVVPRQVLIEVAIAEVTLTDEFQFGLEWYFTNGNRITGKLDAGAAGIGQLVPGISYAWTSKTGDINAVMNMLAKDSKLNIISSPHITVSDNQTAKIQVGDRVPTISQVQSASNVTGVIESVQYIETGVLLSVTPRVNSGGLVTMEINQEVSNASQTTTSTINSPTIQRRTAESTVTVQSGETLVLAGLINENKSKSTDGVPLLSKIPLLGGLFGKQSYKDNRTELIILITPRVLNSVKDAVDITTEYRKRVAGLETMLREHQIAQPAPAKNAAGEPALKLKISGPPAAE